MAQIFSGVVPFPAGDHTFGPFPIAVDIHSTKIEFDGTTFPVGVTTVTILFSFDGGLTFPSSASSTFNGPAPARFPTYRMGFELGAQPTNVQITVSAPSAFSSLTTITTQ